jgi:hypothetical protein
LRLCRLARMATPAGPWRDLPHEFGKRHSVCPRVGDNRERPRPSGKGPWLADSSRRAHHLSGRPDDDQVRLDRRKGGADTPLTVHPRFV